MLGDKNDVVYETIQFETPELDVFLVRCFFLILWLYVNYKINFSVLSSLTQLLLSFFYFTFISSYFKGKCMCH